MKLPTLRSEELTLRPIDAGDLDALAEIITAPGVQEWWGDIGDREKLRKDLASDEDAAFTIEVEGERTA